MKYLGLFLWMLAVACGGGATGEVRDILAPEETTPGRTDATGDVCEGDHCPAPACTQEECEASFAPEVCRRVWCNPATGECELQDADELAPCEDGNPCTKETVCRDGRCVGSPVRCPSEDPCSPGICDVATGDCLTARRPDGERCDD